MTLPKIYMTIFILCALMICSLSQAADKSTPAGTWKWSVTREDGVVVDYSLVAKYDGDKLTGTVTFPNKNEAKIEDASFKDSEVMFTVVQKGGQGRKITIKFKGKLDADKIVGKREVTLNNGDKTSYDWKANREKE
jgi:hypothetical protein